jgi:hypothetical protein
MGFNRGLECMGKRRAFLASLCDHLRSHFPLPAETIDHHPIRSVDSYNQETILPLIVFNRLLS